MLNPNIGKLIKNYDNRYRLVIDVAHNAREIAQEMEETGDLSTEKPVSIAIDKMAAELEKRDDVAINSVTKRDPKTRKVVKVVKSFSLKDENIGARLIEAFEKDEEYAETAIKDMPKGRGKAQKANFTFIYKTDNEKRTYTLNVKESGSVSMTVIISPMKDGQEVGSVVLDPEYWDSFNEQMAELGNNLRDSGIEVRQMSREEMEKMQETIRQSLKGLDAYAIAE